MKIKVYIANKKRLSTSIKKRIADMIAKGLIEVLDTLPKGDETTCHIDDLKIFTKTLAKTKKKPFIDESGIKNGFKKSKVYKRLKRKI